MHDNNFLLPAHQPFFPKRIEQEANDNSMSMIKL